MAAAYQFYRHYKSATIIDLFCYETEYPFKLTSTQKLTRLYRCMLRREKEYNFHEAKSDHQEYHKGIMMSRERIEKIWDVAEGSGEWQDTVNYFRERVRVKMDANLFIRDINPYSPIQGRYYVWSNEELAGDPYGYYSNHRIIGERKPDYDFLYYPNYPVVPTDYVIDPPTEMNQSPDTEEYTKQ